MTPRWRGWPALSGYWVAALAVVAIVALVAILLATYVPRSARTPGASPGGTHVSVSRPFDVGDPSPIYWGAAIQNSHGQAPWNASATSEFEQLAGKGVSLISWSSQFYSSGYCGGYCAFQSAQFDAVRAHGALPFFSWAPNSSSSVRSVDARIASGAEDSYLIDWARAAKAWGHPFFLRFAWEMNGNWFPWAVEGQKNTAADFVSMWRHVHDIFTRAGATNVTWVWCPNVNAATTYQRLGELYPGDSYVDWTCLDGYNGDNPWTSFSDLYRPSYDAITGTIAPLKPLIIGELGSTEVGGSKAAWITTMFDTLPTVFPQIRGFVWSEDSIGGPGGHTDWRIETSRAATAAFAQGLSSPVYVANRFGSIDSSPIPPPR